MSKISFKFPRGQWVNSLRPSDAIWRQWSWTTLAQVMACCLTAPSHYLNQCWLIIRGVLWHSSENSFTGIAQGIDSGYEFEKDILKNIFKSPRGQWVKYISIPLTGRWDDQMTFSVLHSDHSGSELESRLNSRGYCRSWRHPLWMGYLGKNRLVDWLIDSFIHSFVYSFIHSLIHWLQHIEWECHYHINSL